jgi:hypothetical protein
VSAITAPSLNLMPAPRLQRLQLRQRTRVWIAVLVAWTLLLAAVWGYCIFVRAGTENLSAEVEHLSRKVQMARDQIKATQAEGNLAEREAEARREVQDHPDIATLLKRIAVIAGDQITLTTLDMLPVTPPEPKDQKDPKKKPSDLAAPCGYRLRLAGLTTDQVNVPQFAGKLQELQIFESLSIISIRARDGGGVKAGPDGNEVKQPPLFGFELEGVFSDRGAASGQAASPGGTR